MPRLWARTGAALLLGDSENVASDYEGRIFLSSENKMPDPTLVQFDARGNLEYWDLLAPPAPDGWYAFCKQVRNFVSTTLSAGITAGATTLAVTDATGFPRVGTGDYFVTIDNEVLRVTAGHSTRNWTVVRGAQGTTAAPHAAGARVSAFLRDEQSEFRQQGEKMPMGRDFYWQRGDLDPGPTLSDKEKRARVANPPEAPNVTVVTLGGAEGYAAGDWYLGKAWITGNNPATSNEITPTGPAVKVTLTQGQKIRLYLDESPPEGVTGIAWVMGRSPITMRVQERTNVQRRVPESVVLGGPFRRTRDQIGPTSPNRTQAIPGGIKRRVEPSMRDPEAFITEVAFQLRTDQGWSPRSASFAVSQPARDTSPVSEEARLEMTSAADASGGSARITLGNLDGSRDTIDINAAASEGPASIASGIRGHAFGGWKTGGQGSVVTFVAELAGARPDASYSPGTSGAAGNMTTTTQGVSPRSSSVFAFRPEKMGQEVREWRPLFIAADGNWWTIQLSRGGFGKDQWAELHTIETRPEIGEQGHLVGGWHGQGRPRMIPEDEADQSGVEAPEAITDEAIEVFGEERMKPGDYVWRTAYGVGDEKSAPSPRSKVVRLRESSAGSGTSDQVMRVSRPHIQNITNDRFVDQDRDGLDLNWNDANPLPPGVYVGTENGVLTINATGAVNGDAFTLVRIQDEPVQINPNRVYTVRIKADCDRYTSGSQRLQVRYFKQEGDGSYTLLDFDPVEIVMGAQTGDDAETVWVRFGPRGSAADQWYPANTTHIRLAFHVNLYEGAEPDLRVRWSNLAMFVGMGAARKRWPLNTAIGNPSDEDEKRVPADEDNEKPYPNGPYCRVVENPKDGARARAAVTLLANHGFENDNPSTPELSHPTPTNGIVTTVNREAAVSGIRGLLIERATAQNNSARGVVRWDGSNNRSRFAFSAEYKFLKPWRVNGVPSGTGYIMRGRDNAALRNVFDIYLNAENDRLVVSGASGASSLTANVTTRAIKGSRWRIEVECSGVGTSSGKIECRARRGNQRIELAVLSGLDWSGLNATFCEAGVITSPNNSTFAIGLDRVRATSESEIDTEAIPGNYPEYWAPEGTPYGDDRFMVGMKVPVKPSAHCILSAFIGSENLDKTAEIFKTVLKDGDGVVRLKNEALGVLRGDEHWERYWIHFETPPNSEYLEFIGNRIGGGLLRAMGLQLDFGRTAAEGPRPFTNTKATSGYITVTYDTAIPGGDPLDGTLESNPAWLRAAAVVEHDHDRGEPPTTSHSLQFATASTRGAIGSTPWRNTLALVESNDGKQRFVGVRVNLFGTLTRSPVLKAVLMDIARREPIFLDADAQEYPSGCFIGNWPVPQMRRTLVTHEYADGRTGFDDLTIGVPPRTVSGFALRAFSDAGVKAISADAGRDEGVYVVEAYGKRYRIRLLELPFSTDRSKHWTTQPVVDAGRGLDAFWRHDSGDLTAEVLSEESL